MKIVTVTDPDQPDQLEFTIELRSSTLLLLDADGNTVTLLTDQHTEVALTGLSRRVWATRLRYWAEQLEEGS